LTRWAATKPPAIPSANQTRLFTITTSSSIRRRDHGIPHRRRGAPRYAQGRPVYAASPASIPPTAPIAHPRRHRPGQPHRLPRGRLPRMVGGSAEMRHFGHTNQRRARSVAAYGGRLGGACAISGTRISAVRVRLPRMVGGSAVGGSAEMRHLGHTNQRRARSVAAYGGRLGGACAISGTRIHGVRVRLPPMVDGSAEHAPSRADDFTACAFDRRKRSSRPGKTRRLGQTNPARAERAPGTTKGRARARPEKGEGPRESTTRKRRRAPGEPDALRVLAGISGRRSTRRRAARHT